MLVQLLQVLPEMLFLHTMQYISLFLVLGLGMVMCFVKILLTPTLGLGVKWMIVHCTLGLIHYINFLLDYVLPLL